MQNFKRVKTLNSKGFQEVLNGLQPENVDEVAPQSNGTCQDGGKKG